VGESVVYLDGMAEPEDVKILLDFIYHGRVAVAGDNRVDETMAAAKALGIKAFLEAKDFKFGAVAEVGDEEHKKVDADPMEEEEKDVGVVEDQFDVSNHFMASLELRPKQDSTIYRKETVPAARDTAPGNTSLVVAKVKGSLGRAKDHKRDKQCPICMKLFMHSGRLVYHARMQHNIDNLNPFENIVAANGDSFEEEMKTLENESKAPEKDEGAKDLQEKKSAEDSAFADIEDFVQGYFSDSDLETTKDHDVQDKAVEDKRNSLPQQHQCTDCQKVYSSAATLNFHRERQHKTLKHNCVQCDKSFKFDANLRNHVEKKHSGGGGGDEEWESAVHNKKRDRPSKKAEEEKDDDLPLKKTKTVEEEKKSNNDSAFEERDEFMEAESAPETVANDDNKDDSPPEHQCVDCLKVYSTAASLNYHRDAQHLGKTYKCGQCDKTFKYTNSLAVHVKKNHGRGEEKKENKNDSNLKTPVEKNKENNEKLVEHPKKKRGRPKKVAEAAAAANITTTKKLLECGKCAEKFDNEEDLDTHEMVYH
jgi:uncharacterized C2H2 Zn-finger protein